MCSRSVFSRVLSTYGVLSTTNLKIGISRDFTQIRHASKYKAAVLEKAGEPLKLVDNKESKKLKKGQLKIKVSYCAINPLDFHIIDGTHAGKMDFPIVPGYEISGEVLEANECENFAKGDKVIGLNIEKYGGFAEKIVMDETDVWPMPPGLGSKESAVLLDSFGTAMIGLSRMGKIEKDETVLITMAPAHGYAPMDVAANVYKAKVIAVVNTEDEASILRDRGAWSAMVFKEKDVMKQVKELTAGKGVDIIYDTLGGNTLFKCIKHEGQIIVAGYPNTGIPGIETSSLLSGPSFQLCPVSLLNYKKFSVDVYRQVMSDVVELASQKLVSPFIAGSFPLSQVNEAITMVKEKNPVGKVVIKMDS